MEYEHMLRQFLGDEAYGTEGGQYGSSMKKWIKKCIIKSEIIIDKIDTVSRHKQLMLEEVGIIQMILHQKKIDNRDL